MTVIHSGSDLVELDGGIFGRLAFQWIGDRFQHCWLMGDRQCKVLESVESDHSTHWTVSPPLQQVHRQKFADGRDVMFAVGMAGRGHWSVSYTLVPDLNSWVIELACSSPSQPKQLSSRYQLLGDWTVAPAASTNNSSCICTMPDQGIQVEPLSQFTRLAVDKNALTIAPHEIGQQSTATQWGYRIRIDPTRKSS
ncbi:MAG TPA: hypothetical protein DCF63_06300 [Planctomycetaceae bacterium]|nr:hypothetical protein [Planctomycetaceae bacterium]